MRKLFIAADIEGCAGVASNHALFSSEFEWPKAREWMTNEVAAACRAALESGFDEVIVGDGHGNAQNILPDGLPAGTRLIRSWPRPLLQMEGIQEPGVEGCFMIGFHNGAQGDGGVLAHTYHGGAIRDLRLNQVSASEAYFNAAVAGEFGVPVLMITGDQETADDAQRFAPGVHSCIVKEAIGYRSQAAMTPKEASKAIYACALKALQEPRRPEPFSVGSTIDVEIEMTSRLAAEMLSYLAGVRQVGPYTVATSFGSMTDAMTFVTFVILYSPTGRIAL